MTQLHSWLVAESGAVTVDWTVLTAAAAAFGVIVLTQLGSGTNDVAEGIGTNLAAVEVTDLPTLGTSN